MPKTMDGGMALTLCISPHGMLLIDQAVDGDERSLSASSEQRIREAFFGGAPSGMLHLATAELSTPLPPPLAFVQELSRRYLTRLCHTPGLGGASDVPSIPAPPVDELSALALTAPPMTGLEHLTAQVLAHWWTQLDEYVRRQIRDYPKGAEAFLRDRNPLWRLVGKVTFHLAENKRDESHPFAFLATYASRLSAHGRVQHLLLGNSGAKQTRAVKGIAAASRIALTGTPVENRLSDLWSLFDFLNPGLLGDAKSFARFSKKRADQPENRYGPLRALVRPCILRRLKIDKHIIADLPDKTEVKAFCALSKPQVVLYEQVGCQGVRLGFGDRF